jgi:hypothetical protein
MRRFWHWQNALLLAHYWRHCLTWVPGCLTYVPNKIMKSIVDNIYPDVPRHADDAQKLHRAGTPPPRAPNPVQQCRWGGNLEHLRDPPFVSGVRFHGG